MAEYLSPGVYVEEFSSGIKPMEGVSTSTAGFAGMTERGPVRGTPEFVGSFGEFQRIFGGYLPESFGSRRFLPMAVEQFFNNGGSRCFVVRLLNEKDVACAGLQVGPVTFRAANPGTWGNRLILQCRKSLVQDGLYNIVAAAGTEPGDYAESYQDVSMDPSKKEFLGRVLEKSNLLRAECLPGGTPPDLYGLCLEAELAEAQGERAGKLRKAKVLHLLKTDPAFHEEALALAGLRPLMKQQSDAALIEALQKKKDTPSAEDTEFLQNLQKREENRKEAGTDAEKRKALAGAVKAEHQSLADKAVRTPEEDVRLEILTRENDALDLMDKRDQLDALQKKEPLTDEDKAQIKELETALETARENAAREALLEDAVPLADCTEPQAEDNLAACLTLLGGKGGTPDGDPADPQALINPAVLKGSDDGPGRRTGLCALEDIPEVSIVVAPGVTDNAEVQEVIAHCEKMANRVCILDMPETLNKVTGLQAHRHSFTSSFAAMYHPWIQVFDPLAARSVYMPPSGAMAGIYARTDNTRGVHKAPANEVIRSCTGLETYFGKPEQDMLNPLGINLIRDIQGLGIRVWGARTLSDDSQWKYINVRRLFIYIEETIRRNTAWAVFEPNDQLLWTKVRGSIVSFLGTLWRDGALFGATEAEAYFVNIGQGSTMTNDDILNGRLICVIGVAPVRPAEFVIFRITQIMEQNG